MKRVSFSAVVALATVAAACDPLTAPDVTDRVVGILEWETDASAAIAAAAFEPGTVVVAPDSVDAGESFTVTITTIGLSGCWSEDGASKAIDGMTATLTPYDRVVQQVDGKPIVCTAALVALPRDVAVSFAQAGTATLRVEGRRVSNGDVPGAEDVVIEKQIVVR